MAGRRIGSKVRLTAIGKKLYPRWANAVGRIIERLVLTVGYSEAPGKRRYVVAYRVKWGKEKRDYLLGSIYLRKA